MSAIHTVAARRSRKILGDALTAMALAIALVLALACPAWAQGLQGSSVLALDGVDDYVAGTDRSAYDVGTGASADFTLETMFSVSDSAGSRTGTLFHKNGAYSVYILLNVNGDEDRIIFRLWTGPGSSYTYIYHNVTLATGWHHLAAVFDNESTADTDLMAIYLDGSRVSQSSAVEWTPGIPNSSSALNIGGYMGINPFPGWLEETRISRCVRYSGGSYTVRSAPFATDANTLALWHFDEASGSRTFLDSSGAGNGLAGVNGAATYNDTPTPTRVTPAITKTPTGSLYTLTRSRGVAYCTFGATLRAPTGAAITSKRVLLQRSANGTTWSTYATLYTNTYGRVSRRVAFSAAGTTHWRWYSPLDTRYSAVASARTRIVTR
ncbi:MAG: LamG-like jellyroll fold domain-containing protein [Coriobacteriia bacterium]